MKQLDVGLALYVLFDNDELLRVLKFDGEAFWTLTDEKIETLRSALERPFQIFDSKELYPSLIEKASFLFYTFAENHMFENGNKRTAVILTLLFLNLNDKWLAMTSDEMYEFALYVAESESKDMDTVLLHINKIFKKHIRSDTSLMKALE